MLYFDEILELFREDMDGFRNEVSHS